MSEDTGQQQEQIVQEARLLGWVDKEEFRGPESEWTDAETFVKRGKEINPILRENNRRLLAELDKSKREIAEIKRVAEEFKTFQKEAYDRKLEQYQSEIDTLKQAKKDALKEEDHDLVVEIDERISDTKDKIKEAKASPPKPQETTNTEALDPELQLWIDNNKWFGKDVELSQRTNTLGALIAQRNPGLHGKAFLEKLDEALRQEFPEKFGNPNRNKPNPVEGGTANSSGKGKASKHTFENLPADAQAACNRYVKQGLMKQEEYLAMYEWDD